MRRNLVLLVFIFVLLALISVIFLHTSLPADDYFRKGTLPRDVLEQYAYIKDFALQPADRFAGYEGVPQRQWKFQIAFFFYSVCSMAYLDPDFDEEIPQTLRLLLAKMQQRPVWEDWLTDGFGEDPLKQNNMMYRGHLALMFNLYEYVTGDTQYSARAKQITGALHDELLQHPFYGVLCEPDNYYIACNSVAQLSYLFYDRLHGTQLSAVRTPWLAWIRKNMRERSGLLATVYHPREGTKERYQTARHNGWDLVFLRTIAPQFADSLYAKFREQMIRSVAGFAWAAKRPGGFWPDAPGTGFAMAAAHAMKDTVLFGKFLRALQLGGGPVREDGRLFYRRSNLLGDTILLFAKVCCFDELLKTDPPILRGHVAIRGN